MSEDELLAQLTQKEKQAARGMFIKAYREKCNYSIREVGLISGLSSSFISKLEKGFSAPTIDTIDKLSIAFGEDFKKEFLYARKEIDIQGLLIEESYILASKQATKVEKLKLAEMMAYLEAYLLQDDDIILNELIKHAEKLKQIRKDGE